MRQEKMFIEFKKLQYFLIIFFKKKRLMILQIIHYTFWLKEKLRYMLVEIKKIKIAQC